MKIKQLLSIALLLIITGLGARQVSITEFENMIWRYSNIERGKNGLPALVYDDGLADLSRIHSRNMLKYGFFDHKDNFGRYVNDRKLLYYPELIVSSIGENLARFYNTDEIFTPEEIVTGWMNSPLHRENILNKDYTHM
ncbi:MAG: CAP domain-containing protein, partial [Candidatus Cloacimonetes bacterium]|nr:CAP domain-containing protein [Candidatus Cloacimonadota bacterium]